MRIYNKELTINGVIYIGGNRGQFYNRFKEYPLIIYEPTPSSFQKLSDLVRIEHNDYETILVNKALGSKEKIVTMYVESRKGQFSNSILKPKNHLVKYKNITFDETIEVEQTTLDKSIDVIDKYNFIQIDVQGYELEVFKGATETLKHIDYIASELNMDELYENCVLSNDLDEFLSDFGFKRTKTKCDKHGVYNGLYEKIL